MREGKIALVTASSRGIGREIALRLADDAAAVAVHFNSNSQAAEEVMAGIQKKGKLSQAFRADLNKENEAARLIKEVDVEFGKIDILVNNYGPLISRPWAEVTTAEWEAMFSGNLLSSLHCLKAALPGMRERKWGRIINIGYSRAEHLGAFSMITPYAVAKTGLLILTRSVAVSEVKSGITVNMVSPGLIEGGALPGKGNIAEELIGRRADVAEAVSFLSSDKAARITGANIIVAGAWKL
ncbi:MAG: SDR family oxidoreductase [Acidobacteriota bacterium]